MFSTPPTIRGTADYQTVSTSLLQTDNLVVKSLNVQNITTNNQSNTFIAYSGVGTLVGNDLAGLITFDANVAGTNQFRLFFTKEFTNPPIVIVTNANNYICQLETNGGSELINAPVVFNVDTTTEYFDINISPSFVNILPGQVRINYMIIEVK